MHSLALDEQIALFRSSSQGDIFILFKNGKEWGILCIDGDFVECRREMNWSLRAVIISQMRYVLWSEDPKDIMEYLEGKDNPFEFERVEEFLEFVEGVKKLVYGNKNIF